jgi:hypothetical protein
MAGTELLFAASCKNPALNSTKVFSLWYNRPHQRHPESRIEFCGCLTKAPFCKHCVTSYLSFMFGLYGASWRNIPTLPVGYFSFNG